MNNLIQNYEIILNELTKTCSHIESFSQVRQPKLSNLELTALNLTAEYMLHNTELQFFRVIKGTYLETKIERSVYNKRRRKLAGYTEEIRKCICQKFEHLSTLFIVDSVPAEICRYSRAKRSNICSTDIKPNFGYCASQKRHYLGYKLHVVCDENAVINSFDLTPANVHDVNYLKDVKYNLNNCNLIGDRGYISADYQIDLFTYNKINLSVPIRENQRCKTYFSKGKRRKRKRIETLLSQLNGQFSLNNNFAKSFNGFATRIIAKIAALTMIQYINLFVLNRKMNLIKVNIA
jgi:hypothetical protein